MPDDADRRGIDRKLLLVCAFPIFSLATALLGSPTVTTTDPPDALLVFQALGATIITFWVALDARERKYRISLLLWVSLIVLTCVALPYYLFRSRGAGAGFRASGWGLAVFAVTMLSFHLGSRLASGV